jgi:hypothetical protein
VTKTAFIRSFDQTEDNEEGQSAQRRRPSLCNRFNSKSIFEIENLAFSDKGQRGFRVRADLTKIKVSGAILRKGGRTTKTPPGTRENRRQ